MAMKSELQEMVQDLEKAFNETVCESDRIAEVLAAIKASGYDVVLALEVTVGVTADPRPPQENPQRSEPAAKSSEPFVFTAEDREFLQGLQIAG